MTEKHRSITDDFSDTDTTELLRILPSYFDMFSGDPHKTAFLNWRFDFYRDVESQFFEMAKAYFETSLELLDRCIADNHDHKADIWIFPIMFNVVHGIEVYLKGFNSLYRILTKLHHDEYQESKIEGKHDIKQLCHVATKLLSDSKNTEILKDMRFVFKFIEILYQNTNDMTFARYPVTAKGEKHFYNKQADNVTIDLNVFRQWILRVYAILERCTDYIEYEVEDLKEWQAEMRSYFAE